MQHPNLDEGVVLSTMSGVHLLRFGSSGSPDCRYTVMEPDHVAGFSAPSFENPLRSAVEFFIDRANWRYFSALRGPVSGLRHFTNKEVIFMPSKKRWYQSKAIWTCIAGLVTATGAYLTGDISVLEFAQVFFAALIAIFIRSAI